MLTKQELYTSTDFWMELTQNKLFEILESYRESKGYNLTELAEDLGYTKGYVSQLMKGGFNHSTRKLFDLAIKVGKVPEINFMDLNEALGEDNSIVTIRKGKGKVIPISSWIKYPTDGEHFERDQPLAVYSNG